jgi:hypothetical protein
MQRTPLPPPLTPAVRDRLSAEVRAHAAGAQLGAFAYDVLSRQAEGKVLFAGREVVRARAEAHSIERDAAQTSAGNLLTILERGAETDIERAMLAAFAVRGLDDKLTSEEDAEHAAHRFVRHALWLELATPYSVLLFVDSALSAAHAARIWTEVAQATVDESTTQVGETIKARARNAARLSALAASGSPAALEGLRAIARSEGLDATTRRLAGWLADGEASAASSATLEGVSTTRRFLGWTAWLRWLSGWALLSMVGRALLWLLGWRTRVRLSLEPKALTVERERFVLGRSVRTERERIATDSIVLAHREARYPAAPLVLGAVALSAGVLFGGLVLVDGARSFELGLLLAGAAAVGAGALFDLVVSSLGRGARGRVSVELRAKNRAPIRLTRVSIPDADRFLAQLARS